MSGKSNSEQNDVKMPGEDSKDKIYEPKQNKKIIRLLTVIAYVFAVSLAAIMLSLYYVFLWDPELPRHSARKDISIGDTVPSVTPASIAMATVAPSGFEGSRADPLVQKFTSHISQDPFSSRMGFSEEFESQIKASPSSETQYPDQYDRKSSLYIGEPTDLDEPRVLV